MDVDGTLVDAKERHIAAFKLAMRRNGLHCSSSQCQVYYRRRRAGVTARAVFEQLGGKLAESLESTRIALLESQQLLSYDKLVPGAAKALRELRRNGATLVLVSHRRKRRLLERQLERFAVRPLVHAVFISKRSSKVEAVRHIVEKLNLRREECLVIGDTESDIESGQYSGIATVGVLSGIRNRRCIEARKPDFVLDSIRSLGRIWRSGKWQVCSQKTYVWKYARRLRHLKRHYPTRAYLGTDRSALRDSWN
jgi:HAD superfamily hydrolase (TIGR01549 family)